MEAALDSPQNQTGKDEASTTPPHTSTATAPESKDPQPQQLSIKQLKAYPESARKLSLPEATKEGQMQVGGGRGKPFWLSYKVYGQGPVRIVWLCGHGDTIRAWRRHVLHFGHENSDKYASLLVDSRGTGESEGPWGWWSMKNLAGDVVDLLDKLKWTQDSSIHLVGHSMGGMMAQEIALSCPERIASMTLISTTSDWMADLSVLNGVKDLFTMLRPKSEDQRLADVKAHFFGNTWINEADEMAVFPTNGDNWAATCYLEAVIYYRGAALQGAACVRHQVKPEDLKALAAKIGHSNIQILHGHGDKIAPFAAAQRLYDIFGGHHNSGVKLHVFEDTGHMPTIERFQRTVALIEEMTKSGGQP
jgi:pimeloyl-ACP methyl ester carboxylesterase